MHYNIKCCGVPPCGLDRTSARPSGVRPAPSPGLRRRRVGAAQRPARLRQPVAAVELNAATDGQARAGGSGRPVGDGAQRQIDARALGPAAGDAQQRGPPVRHRRKVQRIGAGARAGGPARAGGVRRAGVGAGRGRPGADAESDDAAAARLRPDLPVHQPRPGRGAPPVQRSRGDVPRPHRRTGRARRAVRAAVAPLHPRAVVGRAQLRPDHPQPRPAHPAAGRPAQPVEHPARMPFRRALPLRAGRLPGQRARVAHDGQRPPHGLPPRQRRRRNDAIRACSGSRRGSSSTSRRPRPCRRSAAGSWPDSPA